MLCPSARLSESPGGIHSTAQFALGPAADGARKEGRKKGRPGGQISTSAMTEQSMKRGAKRATHSMMRSWFELEWIGMGNNAWVRSESVRLPASEDQFSSSQSAPLNAAISVLQSSLLWRQRAKPLAGPTKGGDLVDESAIKHFRHPRGQKKKKGRLLCSYRAGQNYHRGWIRQGSCGP